MRVPSFEVAIPALCAGLYLLIALFCMVDYGPTLDQVLGDYRYGNQMVDWLLHGEGSMRAHVEKGQAMEFRDPHMDLSYHSFEWYQLFPFASLFAGMSSRLLWHSLGWVQDVHAYHLVGIVMVAGLLYFGMRFAVSRCGRLAALAGGLLLITSPRFFAHSMSNLKDVPETCLYTLSGLALYVCLQNGRARTCLLSGMLLGFAFAQKANAAFLPLQIFLYWGLVRAMRIDRLRLDWRMLVTTSLACLVSYFAVSPILWTDPVGGLSLHIEAILLAGNTLSDPLSRAATIDPFSGAYFFLITTPIPLLLLAPLGLSARRVAASLRLFLALAVVVPIGRTMLPGMRNFDGVRHFLEFMPALALLAGIGLQTLVLRCRQWGLGSLLCGLALLPGTWATIQTHPHGIAWFNSFVGGLSGAQEDPSLEATDYWAGSYWQALGWLDRNAEDGMRLIVPIAGHVAEAAAPLRLNRRHLWLRRQADTSQSGDLYVFFVTRSSLYGPTILALRDREPVHQILVQGAPILTIHEFDDPEEAAAISDLWLRERRAWFGMFRIQAWLAGQAALRDRLAGVIARDRLADTLDELADSIPEELRVTYEDVRWLLESRAR